MGRTRVRKQITVRAPLEHVFDRITDHEDMGNWPGVGKCELVRNGEPRNGVGAVREIRAGGLTLQEEIVRFEPPNRYDYSIIKGLPVNHLGTVTLREAGDAVLVTWQIEMTSKIPLLAQAVGVALKRGIGGSLKFFARRAEESATSAD